MKYIYLVNLFIAVLASWRITELFVQDRITQKLREKFPLYLWQCPRCMSIWAGVWVGLILTLAQRWPMVALLNWVAAFSWLYMAHLDRVIARRISSHGRRFVIEVKGTQWNVTTNELSPPEFQQIARTLLTQTNAQNAPVQPPAVTVSPAINGEVKRGVMSI